MKTLFAILAAFAVFPSNAEELERKSSCEFCLEKTEVVDSFAENEAEYVFEIQGVPAEDIPTEVLYSIDGENGRMILDDMIHPKFLGDSSQRTSLENRSFRIKTTPGKHVFQIWFNVNYAELYSDSLEIGAQERATYSIHPTMVTKIITVDKPVIYLYPEQESAFEVGVHPTGAFTFTYPTYNEGWSGTMHPDGRLEIADETYRYLFWESQQSVRPLNAQETEGFVLQRDGITNFLESTLAEIGFTTEERADFITFWAPRMIQFDQVFVHFHQDTDCDQFAKLSITPTPDHLHRFYMSWGPLDGDVLPVPQELTPFQRDGFTAIEWGGQQTTIIHQNDL